MTDKEFDPKGLAVTITTTDAQTGEVVREAVPVTGLTDVDPNEIAHMSKYEMAGVVFPAQVSGTIDIGLSPENVRALEEIRAQAMRLDSQHPTTAREAAAIAISNWKAGGNQ